MALRKQGGADQVQYWTNWTWWSGIFMDAAAGICFMASVPFAPCVLLLPTVAISQMSFGYILGVSFFKERSSLRGCLGLVFAAVSVIVAGSSAQDADPVEIKIAPKLSFFWMNGLVWLAIFAAHLSRDCCMLFMILAAYFDGLQFIATKLLSVAILQGNVLTLGMLVAGGLKALFLPAFLHCQQIALDQNLSRVAAAYPVAAATMPVLLATPFFGDKLEITPELLSALLTALLGLVLLSDRPKDIPPTAKEIPPLAESLL